MVAEPISALVKQLDLVAEEIGGLRQRLRQLESERERLKKAIRAADATAHDPKDEAPEKVREAVDFVRKANGPTSTGAVAEALGVTARAANNLLLRAKQLGLVETKSRGSYVPAINSKVDSNVALVSASSTDEQNSGSNFNGS